jgi:hypothetical protein
MRRGGTREAWCAGSRGEAREAGAEGGGVRRARGISRSGWLGLGDRLTCSSP